jgi:hypothetical protein
MAKEEELKEFWEWCGLADCYYKFGFWWGTTPLSLMVKLDLDLNSLFKWAVPKLKEIIPQPELSLLFVSWVEDFIHADKDPAQALYEAIQRARKGGD